MNAVEKGNLLAIKFDNLSQSILGYNGKIYWVTFGSKNSGADILYPQM